MIDSYTAVYIGILTSTDSYREVITERDPRVSIRSIFNMALIFKISMHSSSYSYTIKGEGDSMNALHSNHLVAATFGLQLMPCPLRLGSKAP